MVIIAEIKKNNKRAENSALPHYRNIRHYNIRYYIT